MLTGPPPKFHGTRDILQFDVAEFERLTDLAIEIALGLSEAELARFGIYEGDELAGARANGFAKRMEEKL